MAAFVPETSNMRPARGVSLYKYSSSYEKVVLHQLTAASTWWCGPQLRLGWVEMAVCLPEGPSYPEHSPLFFRYAAP